MKWYFRAGLIVLLCFALVLRGMEYSDFLVTLTILLFLEFRVRKRKNINFQ